MNDDGYTLTEMLVALAVIGMAVGGLTEAVHVLAQGERSAARGVADARDIQRVQSSLDRLLGAAGAAGGMVGTRARFAFPCGGRTSCGAALVSSRGRETLDLTDGAASSVLRLPKTAGDAAFVYGDARGESDRWPPVVEAAARRLEWVELRGGSPWGVVIIADAHVRGEGAP